jgi:hypothetical protein
MRRLEPSSHLFHFGSGFVGAAPPHLFELIHCAAILFCSLSALLFGDGTLLFDCFEQGLLVVRRRRFGVVLARIFPFGRPLSGCGSRERSANDRNGANAKQTEMLES